MHHSEQYQPFFLLNNFCCWYSPHIKDCECRILAGLYSHCFDSFTWGKDLHISATAGVSPLEIKGWYVVLDLFSSWLSTWAWGHDRKEPAFCLAWDQAGECSRYPALQLCGRNTQHFVHLCQSQKDRFFNRKSFVSTQPANVWLMLSFMGQLQLIFL